MRQTDALSVVSGVAGTNADLTWEWMQENWDTLEEMYDTAVSAPIGRLEQKQIPIIIKLLCVFTFTIVQQDGERRDSVFQHGGAPR